MIELLLPKQKLSLFVNKFGNQSSERTLHDFIYILKPVKINEEINRSFVKTKE